eukprot:SAG22_NODE_958_length_6301_cov_4.995324_14_plen_124_part_00
MGQTREAPQMRQSSILLDGRPVTSQLETTAVFCHFIHILPYHRTMIGLSNPMDSRHGDRRPEELRLRRPETGGATAAAAQSDPATLSAVAIRHMYARALRPTYPKHVCHCVAWREIAFAHSTH